jgi:hypothetical protein
MMRTFRTFVVLVVLGGVLLLPAATAFGEDADGAGPAGRYSGSAVGGKGKPFAVTVYVSEAGGDDVEVTVVTPKVPIPISVTSEAKVVPGGFDIPVSISIDAVKLSGDGVIRLRQRDGGDWVLYGSGSGSFEGKSGKGTASAKRTGASASTGEQVIGAIEGFLSFGEPAAETVRRPEPYDEADWVRTDDGAGESEVGATEESQPVDLVELGMIIASLILLLVIFSLL